MQKLILLCFLTFTKALFVLAKPAVAQSNIVPDTTLNENSSVVTPLDSLGFSIDEIQGGLSLENNLFHSFLEFNVDEGRSAYFVNRSNQTENILSRVTGSSHSEILGTLGIARMPGVTSSPNLLFINPNGILFGPNSSLDLPASFVASTADAVQLGEEGLFSAGNPQEDRLLSVNPSALFFNDNSSGFIISQAVIGSPASGVFANPLPSIPQSTQIGGDDLAFPLSGGLQVPDSRRLAIVGGEITLEGILSSVGGIIDIGSVSGRGRVRLNLSPNGFTTDYSEAEQLGNIRLSSATVNASGFRGGGIQIQAARIFTENNTFSAIFADAQGDLGSEGVFVRATEALLLENAGISTVVQSGVASDGGSIRIKSPVILIDGLISSLLTRNFGTGKGGDINVETDRLILREGAAIITSAFGTGVSGGINVNASELVDAQGIIFSGEDDPEGGIQADAGGTSVGGDINIVTKDITLSNGAIISARTEDGAGGSVAINSLESVILSSEADIRTVTIGQGNAGDIQIRTQRIQTGDGSEVDASARFGSRGSAGDIDVLASESIEIDGVDGGFISAVILGFGNGGNLTIRTPFLSLKDGGNISSTAFTSGSSGSIKIFSDIIEIDGGNANGFTTSQITTAGSNFSGRPTGDITIQTDRLAIRNGGSIAVDSIASDAPGGNLRIEASESIEVSGRLREPSNLLLLPDLTASRISGRTSDSTGGEITIITPELNIADGGIVSTTSTGEGRAGDINFLGETLTLDTSGRVEATSSSGNGGNLSIQLSDLLLLRRGGAISTSAGTERAGGNGGNVNIVSPFLVAIPQEDSDITANAFSGEGGQINIQATGIFGIDTRPMQTPLSDITASSDVGTDGIVDINALNTDFIEEGLTELPSALVSPETVISSSCIERRQDDSATLVIASSDRPPSSPTDSFISAYATGTAQSIPSEGATQLTGSTLSEPQAVYRSVDGRFVMSQECDL